MQISARRCQLACDTTATEHRLQARAPSSLIDCSRPELQQQPSQGPYSRQSDTARPGIIGAYTRVLPKDQLLVFSD
jgi:hypothetical protein